MFSGIIETLGVVVELKPIDSGQRLTLRAEGMGVLKMGESVCTNGVCLTVIEQKHDTLAYDLSHETLRCSSLGGLKVGDRVNLERSLAMGDRLGGHFVSGHVDGVGRVIGIEAQGAGSEFTFEAPANLMPYIAEKGSVSVEGVSLTTWAVQGNTFKVAFIPHTLAVTNLGQKQAGSPVNLEIDLLARYLHRLLSAGAVDPGALFQRQALSSQALDNLLGQA
jgi:riboflavin synthase